MNALEAVRAARELLETVTPLQRDCGRYCGAACCLIHLTDPIQAAPKALFRKYKRK